MKKKKILDNRKNKNNFREITKYDDIDILTG